MRRTVTLGSVKPKITQERRLRLEFSGNLIKHLGLQMYGGPVPALAELVANAWDADAHNVSLMIPLDKPIGPELRIVIKDDGRGMSWEDVARNYLVIGRDRRHAGGNTTRAGRQVMGRKGIGKLAGFGIARIVELRTVRNRWLTHFVMDYEQMMSDDSPRSRYEPEILADEETAEKHSTTVILRELNLQRAIPGRAFRESLARRFAVLSDSFVVRINGEALRKGEMPLDFRFPNKAGAIAEATIDGFGKVSYWYGFTKDTIKDEDARGLSVFVRGRMAAVPGTFNISGGVWNQASIEYLTGEVHADELDESEDLINTNRQSINWKEAPALQEWGQRLIRTAARSYDQYKKVQARENILGEADARSGRELRELMPRLSPRLQETVNKLFYDYSSLADGRKTSRSLDSAVRGIINLGEAAAPVLNLNDPSADISVIIRRRKSVLDALAVADKRSSLTILRANPWIVSGAWRLSINDPEATEALNEARKRFPSLAKFSMWIIRFERRRTMVVVAPSSDSLPKSLMGLKIEMAKSQTFRSLGVVVVAPKPDVRQDDVVVTSISQLITQGLGDCQGILSALGDQ